MTTEPTLDHFEIVMSSTFPGLARVEPVSRFAEDGEALAMSTANKYAAGWPDYHVMVRAHRTDGSWSTRLMVYPQKWPRTIQVAA